MKKIVLALVSVSVLGGIAWVVWGRSGESSAAAAGTALARPTLTVEVAPATRGAIAQTTALLRRAFEDQMEPDLMSVETVVRSVVAVGKD